MSLPLSIILKELESAPVSIIPILATLHHERSLLNEISKADLKHLTSRTLNLCRSSIAYNIWCGVNIVNVLVDNISVLGAEGSAFLAQLLKILESPKSNNKRVFKSTVECLNKLCDSIRGKPTLTREILTPNLSAIFTVYMEKMIEEPILVISSLQTLIQYHPTTSRPFANKIKAKLLEFVGSPNFLNYPSKVKDIAWTTLATMPVVEKEGPDQCWLKDVEKIMKDITGTLQIYDSFLNLKDDEDVTKLIKKLTTNNQEKDEIFPLLHIDVNEPNTLFQISQRLELLLNLLQGYVTTATQFSVVVPIGRLITLLELICSINTKFVQFKREIRDNKNKEIIQFTLLHTHEVCVHFLFELPYRYFGSLLPHLPTILAFLELLIFFKGKRLDYAKILIHEGFICDILRCVNRYLSLVGHYQDHTQLARFVEVALSLVEPRSTHTLENGSQNHSVLGQKSSKKRSKKNNSTPLADLLSHQHLFQESIPESTRKAVLGFLKTVMSRVSLAPTQYNRLMRYILVEATKLKDSSISKIVPDDVRAVLIESLLNPGSESASDLPFVSNLLWDSNIVSVFNNPRFPPVPSLASRAVQDKTYEDESDDEYPEGLAEEVENTKSEEPLRKRAKIESSNDDKVVELATDCETVAEDVFSKESKKIVFETRQEVAAEEFTVQETSSSINIETLAQEVYDDEAGSEIEIPDLDIEEDSEEES